MAARAAQLVILNEIISQGKDAVRWDKACLPGEAGNVVDQVEMIETQVFRFYKCSDKYYKTLKHVSLVHQNY
jgi:hypothetical protein